MGLQLLEFLIRIQIGIFIVETNHQSDMDEVRLHVVQERPGIGIAVNWPSNCMLDISRLEQFVTLIDFPDFLEADSIELRVTLIPEVEFLHDLFGKGASASLGKDCLSSQDLHASHEGVLDLSFLGDPKVSGSNTCDMSFLGVEYF